MLAKAFSMAVHDARQPSLASHLLQGCVRRKSETRLVVFSRQPVAFHQSTLLLAPWIRTHNRAVTCGEPARVMACVQSMKMLTDKPLSRAGLLPQWIFNEHHISFPQEHLTTGSKNQLPPI
ncbi:hypothetical protein CES87_26835 [Pseudomonas sp. ERMR1:02]|nr:hypothetical protein CES87_26835 [Pseudomonas sp. ERMR1:02]